MIIHREVERKAEARGVCRLERDRGVLVRVFVGVERRGGVRVVRLVLGEFGEVAIVVAAPVYLDQTRSVTISSVEYPAAHESKWTNVIRANVWVRRELGGGQI